jgi:hypothetical protein
LKRLLLVVFFFEVGFVLIIVPWSQYWDRNYFAETVPAVRALITNNFVRGAVSGLGLINVVFGLVELVSMVMSRHADDPASINPSRFVKD